MVTNYLLSCESTADLPYEPVCSRGLSVLPYPYSLDGKVYMDDMGRDPEVPERVCRALKAGNAAAGKPGMREYCRYFRSLLSKGDVLHIALGSGAAASVESARRAAALMRAEFPGRQLRVVDSLCASGGYGLLVDSAADLWEAGAEMDALETWLVENRSHVHQRLYTSDPRYLVRSGLLSGPVGASVLSLRSLLRLNARGKLVSCDRARGSKAAIRATVEAMARHAAGGSAYDGKVFISHAGAPAEARAAGELIARRFARVRDKIRICSVGTAGAAFCGPGTVAVSFMGDART